MGSGACKGNAKREEQVTTANQADGDVHEQLENAKRKLLQTEHDCLVLLEEKEGLEKKLLKTEHDCLVLLEEKEGAEKALAAAEAPADPYQNQFHDLEHELEQLKALHADTQEAERDARTQLADEEKRHQDLLKKLERVSAQLESRKESEATAISLAGEREESTRRLQSQCDELQDQLARAKITDGEVRDQLEEFKDKLKQMEQGCLMLREQKEGIEQALATAKAAIDAGANQSHVELDRALETQQVLNHELEQMKALHAKTQEAEREARIQLAYEEKNHQHLQNELEQVSSQLASARESEASAIALAGEREESTRRLQSQCDELQKQLARAKKGVEKVLKRVVREQEEGIEKFPSSGIDGLKAPPAITPPQPPSTPPVQLVISFFMDGELLNPTYS